MKVWSHAANDIEYLEDDDPGIEVCDECDAEIEGITLFEEGDPLCVGCYVDLFGPIHFPTN